MADIHIERIHRLGLIEAREVAERWCRQAAEQLDLVFTVLRGETRDTVEFARSGVKGSLQVEADRFTLDAKLGFLLGAFSEKIKSEIERNFDDQMKMASDGR